MYRGSAKYRDACDSGKIIYSSFYRTLLELNKVQLLKCDVNKFLAERDISNYALVGCNDVTEIFAKLFLDKETIIYESNIKKYRPVFKEYKLMDYQDIGSDSSIQLYIVMSNYNFNEHLDTMQRAGIDIAKIISIEELLADVIVDKGVQSRK